MKSLVLCFIATVILTIIAGCNTQSESVTLNNCKIPFSPIPEDELEEIIQFMESGKTPKSVPFALNYPPLYNSTTCAEPGDACQEYNCAIAKAANTTDPSVCSSLPQKLTITWECTNRSEIPALIQQAFNITPGEYNINKSSCSGSVTRKATGTLHNGEPFVFLRMRTIPGYAARAGVFSCFATNGTERFISVTGKHIVASKPTNTCVYTESKPRIHRLRDSCRAFAAANKLLVN